MPVRRQYITSYQSANGAERDPVAEPIVFVRYDARPEKEALVVIYRPDSTTTRGEKQLVIRASSLAADAVDELHNFIDVARPVVEKTGRALREKPIETLHVDVGGEGISVEEW
jgi:hypothetical protein